MALFAAATVLVAAFVAWEGYAARAGRDPMLDPSVFRSVLRPPGGGEHRSAPVTGDGQPEALVPVAV